MIETKEKEIDGRMIMVTQFPGRRALSHKTRLIKLLGPAVAQLFTEDKIDLTKDISSLSKVIDKLSSTLDENDFVRFVLDLLKCTRLDGKEITEAVFDDEFSGDLLLMYKILWYTLEVNYGNFFAHSGIGKILSTMPRTQTKETKTNTKSSE
jgi:hypothetical protein